MPEEPTNTKVRMRVQDHNARAVYANAFRHNSTPKEIILDLGINTVTGRHPADNENETPTAEMLFQVDTRLVLNYDTARRLAGLLSQLIQRYDEGNKTAAVPQTAQTVAARETETE